MNRDLSISQVARQLQIRRESVRQLIEHGWLEAYDAAPPDARRRAYRISEQALHAYKESRKVRKQLLTRRRSQKQPVTEYF
ncbi:MAG: excisionase family DNA-binding protein [Planctomycetaceae bacterium]